MVLGNTIACATTPATQYGLIIDSTGGGSVIMPGEGTSTYDEGTEVNLVATPDTGYQFVNWTGNVGSIADVNAPATTITMNDHYSITTNFGKYTPMVAAGAYHTLGLQRGGTVVAVGRNYYGQCDVGGWTDIVQIAAGGWHTAGHSVGVKSDGTVVAVGSNGAGQCDVDHRTDIVQVTADYSHTVGLNSDGTVVAAGLEMELAKWDLKWTFPRTSAHKGGGTVILSLRATFPFLLLRAHERCAQSHCPPPRLPRLTSSASQRQKGKDCFGTIVPHNYRERKSFLRSRRQS